MSNDSIALLLMDRTTIDLEPKIRMAEQNLILLPKKNTCFCLHE